MSHDCVTVLGNSDTLAFGPPTASLLPFKPSSMRPTPRVYFGTDPYIASKVIFLMGFT